MRRARRAGSCCVAIAALCAVFAASAEPRPAIAQERSEQQPSGAGQRLSLTVVALDATVSADQGLRVAVRVTERTGRDVTGLRLRTTLETRTRTRLELQRALDGSGGARRAVQTVSTDLADLGAGRSSSAVIEASAAELGLGAVPDALAGAYPLRVEVLENSEVVAQRRTAVVAVPPAVGEPIRTALVVAVDSAFGRLGDQTFDTDPLAGDLGGNDGAGRVPSLVEQLATGPPIPVTLAVDGAVIEEALDGADGYVASDEAGTVAVGSEDPPALRARALVDGARAVASRPQTTVTAAPFANADLVALASVEGSDLVREALRRGAVATRQALDATPSTSVLRPPAGLDAATLDRVASAGIQTVVLGEADVRDAGRLGAGGAGDGGAPGPPQVATRSPVRRLPTDAGEVTAVVGDDALTGALDGDTDEGPAIAAQRVLAETAAVYFERPFSEETRGLVIAPPPGWDHRRAGLGALLRGLDAAPWLEPVGVDRLVREVDADPAPAVVQYPARARRQQLPHAHVAAVVAARRDVATLGGVTSDDGDDPGRLLLLATSTTARSGLALARAQALVEAVSRQASGVLAAVAVLPGPQITFSGREGRVPVTIANDAEVALAVDVQVLADPRFRVAEPVVSLRDENALEAGERRLVEFTAEALAPGAPAPLQVVVTDPSGDRVLARGEVVVRSTAYSVAALVLVVGAGTFLAVWWVRDLRARRVGRRPPRVTPRERVPT